MPTAGLKTETFTIRLRKEGRKNVIHFNQTRIAPAGTKTKSWMTAYPKKYFFRLPKIVEYR